VWVHVSGSRLLARFLELLPVAMVLLATASLPGTRRRGQVVADGGGDPSQSAAPELALSKPGVALRVTTTKSGSDLLGATQERLAAVRVRVFHNDKNGTYLVGSGVTDVSGVAVFESLPAGETWVLADIAGRARASHWLIWTGAAAEMGLALAPEETLDVALVDELGAAVQGEITVSGDDPVPLGVRTDKNGHVRVGALRGARFALMARAPGFDATPRSDLHPGERVVVTMQKLAALRYRSVQPRFGPRGRCRPTSRGSFESAASLPVATHCARAKAAKSRLPK
jgi:hypothetical protein